MYVKSVAFLCRFKTSLTAPEIQIYTEPGKVVPCFNAAFKGLTT